MGRTIHGKRTKGGSTAKLTNNCCIFGIMGGTAPLTGKPLAHRAYLEKRASRKALCITDCAQGHKYLKDNQILGCNPQAGGVGNMWRHRHYSHRWGPTPEGDGSAHGSRGIMSNLQLDPLCYPFAYDNKTEEPIVVAYLNTIHKYWATTEQDELEFIQQFSNPYIYGVTHLLVSFWRPTSVDEYKDATQYWVETWDKNNGRGKEIRKKVRDEINKEKNNKGKPNGMAIMCSAFGATAHDIPLMFDGSGTRAGKEFAHFIIDNDFDGGDLDFEDKSSLYSNGPGVSFLIDMTNEMRKVFNEHEKSKSDFKTPGGFPHYIISHAPEAPLFADVNTQGGYLHAPYRVIEKDAGNSIDFYNIQFYNQGDTAYNNDYSLYEDSGSIFPNTSILSLTCPLGPYPGIPGSKIVIGKPIVPADVVNSGYIEINELYKIINDRQFGKNVHKYKVRGVMGWQWKTILANLPLVVGNWTDTMYKALTTENL